MMRNNEPIYSPEHQAYINGLQRKKRFILSMRILLLISIMIFWEFAAEIKLIDPFITSSPSRVVSTIIRFISSGELWTHIAVTLFETTISFILGTVLGTLLAILLWWSKTLSKILDPYLVVLNALPKIALGPILIVWFGSGMTSIIVMGMLISIIVTTISVLSGFNDTTSDMQLLMRTLGATKLQTFLMVVFPASVPTIIAALKLSVSMSWVGVIVGEYLVSKDGLGYLIVYGGQVFKLDLVMASIIVLCILAALMYYAVAYIEKRFTARHSHG